MKIDPYCHLSATKL